MTHSDILERCLSEAASFAFALRHQFLTPEHMLLAFAALPAFKNTLKEREADLRSSFYSGLQDSILGLEKMPPDIWEEVNGSNPNISFSHKMQELYELASLHAQAAGRSSIDVPHMLFCMFDLEETMASLLLLDVCFTRVDFMTTFSSYYDTDGTPAELDLISVLTTPEIDEDGDVILEDDEDVFPEDTVNSTDSLFDLPSETNERKNERESGRKIGKGEEWRKDVVCLNDIVDLHNPLIGREKELERTVQVLCRKEKNNPLHIGEPGVGKTAIVYGLARLINEGKVPARLKGSRIYRMEMGGLVAGTRFRGDFEQKLQRILEGVSAEGNSILYIDEVHTMMGAGATGEGNLDASNILKRYLEENRIRFIGTTTFSEHKRTIGRDTALSRRFQEIEIAEPSEEEAIGILLQLQPLYEEFHNVSYADGVMEMAVRQSARHIHGRYLPDKALDLIDEAGAWREIHPATNGQRLVDAATLSEVLARVAKVEALAIREESGEDMRTLADRIRKSLYGQDEAVQDVVESVLMARAGLSEEHRPLGSFLFVGPTGVGKTELARVLAKEMGIGLVRFDMSEFAEKHSVAKLIGSPAGYVGYEDGGLLTDAIRKQPNCVLLLDEVEKAHPDIYDILLQVMDYAKLTDNQGREADFSNVVIIMTSNAGARFASRASVGFGSSVSAGHAMMKEVKRIFKPEFINRLTAIEVFNDMDDHMADMILDKALNALHGRLEKKNVKLQVLPEARALLLEKGLSREYGARELHRVIESLLTRPLGREILFGRLRHGGVATIASSPADARDRELTINIESNHE